MLEYVYMTNRVRVEELISSMMNREKEEESSCMHGHFLQSNMMVGLSYLEAQGAPDSEKERLIGEALRHLVQHEVGHTLGLNHNMKSSSSVSLSELHDLERAQKEGLVPSVMDYTPVNLAPKGVEQGKFFSDIPGEYDRWAIAFGYTPSLDDPDDEAKRQAELLSKSMNPKLTFGNDADDMRSAYGGIDPRTNVGDLSSDLVGWAEQQVEITSALEGMLMQKYKREGESWEALRRSYYMVRWMKVGSLFRLVPMIGGIHVERGVTEQFADGALPFVPVSKEEQLRSLDLLCAEFFADGALQPPSELIPYLQKQRRGFGFFGATEDPKLHQTILDEQSYVLYRLLNENIFQRLSDAQKYGGEMTAHLLVDRLTRAIFSGDRLGSISDERKNLQVYYAEELLSFYLMLDMGTDRAAVAHGLRLSKSLSTAPLILGGDASSKAHRLHLQKILKGW
jgi:hypothetical protein